MKPPSSLELPTKDMKPIKSSESVVNILSFLTPSSKVMCTIRKSKSIESFPSFFGNQECEAKQEEEEKCHSNSIFFSTVDPFDPAIYEYLQHYQNILANIKCKRMEMSEMIESRSFKVSNLTNDRKIIIFDIDGTLAFSVYPEFCGAEPYVIIRPHCIEVLQSLSKYYDIWIWTAAEREHAEHIINKYLDPNKNLIKQTFFREHCINVFDNVYIKDIRIFSNVLPSNIAIIDDQLVSFATNIDNGFLVSSFNGNEASCDLQAVEQFFLCSRQNKDIRTMLISTFKLSKCIGTLEKNNYQNSYFHK